MGWKRYRRRFKIIVRIHKDPYLIRYRIIVTPWICIYLHKILRSDSDRELHDHPFNFCAFILWGSYTEELLQKGQKVKKSRPWLSFIRHKATDFHRLELDAPVWTLFIRGRKYREWGFRTQDGKWKHWEEFLDAH